MTPLRVGQGFDVHRYRAGRPLRLCGVELAGEVGLDGHSDADVALHAAADAILGAVGAGDIGVHFPPDDPRFEDADSRELLGHVVQLARRAGYRLVNCDVTIIGERPKIAPHREALQRSLADVLGLAPDAASVKATTTEGLGFTGRGEGLAALAVVLVERVDEE